MRTVILFLSISLRAFAQSPTAGPRDVPVRIQMPNSPISDFIKLYRSLSHRKVWIDAELRFDRKMSISNDHLLARAEAIALIRDALRKEGVEIREVGDSEAYVARLGP
jgi:hypothetical protein